MSSNQITIKKNVHIQQFYSENVSHKHTCKKDNVTLYRDCLISKNSLINISQRQYHIIVLARNSHGSHWDVME